MRPTRGVRHQFVLLWGCALGLCSMPAHAQIVPPGYRIETFASGLDVPCAFDFLPDGRVLFTEQNTGFVRLFRAGAGVQAQPVIRVPALVAGGERGLLGIAVDPAFATRPYVYLFFSTTGARSAIVRYRVTGDLDGHSGGDLVELPNARTNLLSTLPDQAPNHNGGTLRFASDSTLIASLGDDAFPCGAQDSTGLRGVILRIETRFVPDGLVAASIAALTPAGNPYASSPDSNARLVLARGLRNPFRVQCEATLPWLFIGDVGENLREELDLLVLPGPFTRMLGMARPGANFGWPYREGTSLGAHANECAPAPDLLAAPAYDYDRTSQQFGAAIIPAGFVFPVITLDPGVQPQPGLPPGLYLSDYYSGALVRLDVPQGTTSWPVAPPVAGQPSAGHFGEGFAEVSDWRVDGQTLWFVRQSQGFAAHSGSIGRLSAVPLPPPLPPPVQALALEVLATPAVGGAGFRLSADNSLPGALTIHGLDGRVIRRWSNEEFQRFPAGLRVDWDGHDADGRKVRPGLYVARLESGGRVATARVTFLR